MLYDEYLSADGAIGIRLSNLFLLREDRIYTGTPASPCVLLTEQWEVRDIFQHHYSTHVLRVLSAIWVIFLTNMRQFGLIRGVGVVIAVHWVWEDGLMGSRDFGVV